MKRSLTCFGYKFVHSKAFVCFGHDLVNHGFRVLSAFPHHQLPIRTGALAQNSFDVRHLALAAELFHFRRDEFEDLVNQTARLQFAAAAEIDQLPAEAIARRAPAIFFEQAARINPKGDVLPQQFVQLRRPLLASAPRARSCRPPATAHHKSEIRGYRKKDGAECPTRSFRIIDAARRDEQFQVIFILG